MHFCICASFPSSVGSSVWSLSLLSSLSRDASSAHMTQIVSYPLVSLHHLEARNSCRPVLCVDAQSCQGSLHLPLMSTQHCQVFPADVLMATGPLLSSVASTHPAHVHRLIVPLRSLKPLVKNWHAKRAAAVLVVLISLTPVGSTCVLDRSSRTGHTGAKEVMRVTLNEWHENTDIASDRQHRCSRDSVQL